MDLRGAKAIPDENIKKWISSIDMTEFLYDPEIKEKFIESFKYWLVNSKNNSLQNLQLFNNVKVCNGTAHAFDTFHWRHRNKRFLFFKGEFMYHGACFKNKVNWRYINYTEIKEGDVIIISTPFSDYGKQHITLPVILDTCDTMNVPVLLDFAHLPCTKNINVNLDHKCIDMITFSLSKAFYGAENLRLGIRFERKNTDDSIDILNSINMVNNISLGIGIKYMNSFHFDYNWNKYKKIYYKVCRENTLEPTDCIMFGIGDDEWESYNRGNETNRVCVSDLIGEKINANNMWQ